jgi:two-component system, NarL family, nitrate/nitrite response regulator NarL
MSAIKTLVVAGTRVYRDGLAHALAACDEIEVVGTAAGRGEALELIRFTAPAVVLSDASGGSASVLARSISARSHGPAVVAIAVSEDEHDVVGLAEAGVSAFVPHGASLDDLVGVVVAVAAGGSVCTPRITAVLLAHVAALAASGRALSQRRLPHLTARELEVVDLIAEGLSNKEIASRLRIELPTVKNHVHNLLDKLEVRRRTDAVARVQGLPIVPRTSSFARAAVRD